MRLLDYQGNFIREIAVEAGRMVKLIGICGLD